MNVNWKHLWYMFTFVSVIYILYEIVDNDFKDCKFE